METGEREEGGGRGGRGDGAFYFVSFSFNIFGFFFSFAAPSLIHPPPNGPIDLLLPCKVSSSRRLSSSSIFFGFIRLLVFVSVWVFHLIFSSFFFTVSFRFVGFFFLNFISI